MFKPLTFAGTGDRKTPTLREYLRENEGNPIPELSFVKSVWKPGEYENYTFVTEHFKVHVYKGSDLFDTINDSIDEWSGHGLALFVRVVDRASAIFLIGANPSEKCSWESTKIGFKITIEERKSLTQKTSAAKKRNGQGSIDPTLASS